MMNLEDGRKLKICKEDQDLEVGKGNQTRQSRSKTLKSRSSLKAKHKEIVKRTKPLKAE
jgi:hypothetical protein